MLVEDIYLACLGDIRRLEREEFVDERRRERSRCLGARCGTLAREGRDDGCGYCRNPECNVLGTANCLMCRGFVTTPAHIAQFEEALAILTRQIIDNENLHDKEHLYAVKRLYAAYLEQLYIRKEEVGNARIS